MSEAMRIKAISAAPAPPPGVQKTKPVAKMIDVSSCIGCKACEVACKEWNDLPPEPNRPFTGSYQTRDDLGWDLWQLIKFNEVVVDGRFEWTLTKYQCMHCADPGCLKACPAPGAIVQYENGIVDFVQENCIGCGYCITGCPFDVPRFNPENRKVYKCTLCSDRVARGLEPACAKTCPTNCIHFGAKDELLRVAQQRVNQLKALGFASAGIYDPPGVGGTNVIYVLPHADQPEVYGLPRDPKVSPVVRLWKGPLKWIGKFVLWAGVLGAFLHYIRFGPRPEPGNE